MGEYSVATKNRFIMSLGDDEDVDPYDILREQQERKEKKVAEPEPAKNVTNNQKSRPDQAKKGPKASNQNVEPAEPPKDVKGARKDRPPRRGNENQPPRMRQNNDRFNRLPRDGPIKDGPVGDGSVRDSGPASSSRFRGGGRGGGRGVGRRNFDRHSGSEKTGIKAVEKREGSGPHNWGNEIAAQLEETTIDEAVTPVAEDAEPEDESEAVVAPKEPEVQEMTLDEYKKTQRTARAAAQFNVRRAGEGEDPKQWKDGVVLPPRKRQETEETEEGEESEVLDKRTTLEKLNIQITFSDSGSSRGDRGGGFRGGRGRGRGGVPRRLRDDTNNAAGGGFDRPPRFDADSGRPPRSAGFGGRGGSRKPMGAPRGGSGGPRRLDTVAAAPRVDSRDEFPSLS